MFELTKKPRHAPIAKRTGQPAFTIVEIMIAVVVIAIIAGISVVTYVNIQKTAAEGSVLSQLRQITQRVESMHLSDGRVPEAIDSIAKTSPDVQIVFVNAAGESSLYYSNLSEAQNGVLFYNHCKDLVSEGYGNGPNDFGANTIAYISGCRVYDVNYLQINGWNGGFNVSSPSVTQEMLQSYIDAAIARNPDHPSYHETVQNFMNELIRRFTSEGGHFPITEFWRPWVGIPTLPPPESSSGATQGSFCIVATHAKYSDISYVTTSGNLTPRAGASCS